MPRPPTAVGTHGTIRVNGEPGHYVARAWFRDLDGKARQVERSGSTKTKAKDALKLALRDRARTATGISGDTRIREIAPEWLAGIDAAVNAGERSPSTAEQYRRQLDVVVLPGVGELRVREATVPLLDSFIQTVQVHRGTAAAKLARSVLALGGATDPAVRPPSAQATRRSLRVPRLASQSRTDARDKDLPDLCRFMIGTGVRIGEALAVAWPEVDLDEATVDVSRTLIRLTGVGLIRKSTKTETGERILTLPRFVVTMLRRRNPDGDALGPVFPDTLGGWRDPSNTRRALRDARGSEGFAWVTSHVFRRTCATILDQSGQSTRSDRRSARPRTGLDDPEPLPRPAHRQPRRCCRARRMARPGGRTSWVIHGLCRSQRATPRT